MEGAEPSDVLAVDILDVDVDDYGFTCTIGDVGALKDKCELRTRKMPNKDGLCYFNDVCWPLDPMIGVMGVAPAGDPIISADATDTAIYMSVQARIVCSQATMIGDESGNTFRTGAPKILTKPRLVPAE